MTFSKHFIVILVALLALLFERSHSQFHGDKQDHDTHHSNHGRLLNSTVSTAKKSQKICGFTAPTKKQMSKINKALSTLGDINTNDIISITVYFHVITDGVNGKLTYSDLLNQLDVLNQRYAPAGFYFIFGAYDIVNNPFWFNNPGYDDNAASDMKHVLRRGDSSTLNVYFVKMTGPIGYAYLPDIVDYDLSLDGVVIEYTTIPGGSFPKYDLGITLVHEVGHWLGLLHTFGDNDGTCDPSSKTGGDFISDTPAEAYSGIDGPDGGDCPIGRDTCPTLKGIDVSNS